MSRSILRPARYLAKALLDDEHPRRLAWGVALGVMIGLMPKGNLCAMFLATILFSLRVNLPAGLGVALAVSLIGPLLDPCTDAVGRAILQMSWLQEPFAWFYQLPIVPWTDFNNTVVLGSLVVGLVQLYPTYRCTCKLAEKHHRHLADHIRQYRITRVLLGAELATQWRA